MRHMGDMMMFNPISKMMNDMLLLQGKSPITGNFVDQVTKYYKDKLKKHDVGYIAVDDTRTMIVNEITKYVETLYPQDTMKALRDNKETENAAIKIRLDEITIEYLNTKGKKERTYGLNFLRGDDFDKLYIMRGATDITFDATKYSEKIRAAREAVLSFNDTFGDLRNNLMHLIDSCVSIEDVFELLPELKEADFVINNKDQFVDKRILKYTDNINSYFVIDSSPKKKKK